MKINVTEEDIRDGIQFSYGRCPIARAIKRQGVAKYPQVFSTTVSMGIKAKYLPPIAQLFIKNFDLYGAEAVVPFSFELED